MIAQTKTGEKVMFEKRKIGRKTFVIVASNLDFYGIKEFKKEFKVIKTT